MESLIGDKVKNSLDRETEAETSISERVFKEESVEDLTRKFYQVLNEKNIESVKHLVRNEKANINHVFSETFVEIPHRNWTALHFVCARGNLDHLKILISLGADPSLANKKGDTPLHLVCKHGHYQCVEYLLKHNDTLKNRQDLLGLTPLMKAIYRFDTAFKEKDYKKTINLLLGAGCNVNLSPESNMSPLHVVAGKWKSSNMAKILLRAGADVNADTGSSSPLMMGLCRQRVDSETVIVLINAGANVNYINPNGKSALHIAVSKSEDICVEHLLSAGADPNNEDADGNSPLWIAVCENNIKIAPLLLANGANVNFTNKPYKLSLLSKAASNRKLDMVKLLLDHDADINSSTALGASALHYAVYNGDIPTVKLLLSKNCDLEDYSVFIDIYNPQNALQIAFRQGDESMIKLLLRVGFPVREHYIKPKMSRLGAVVSENEELVDWIYDFVYTPPSLLHLSRIQLRKMCGSTLIPVLDVLTRERVIPQRLADLILMQDLLNSDLEENSDEI